MAKPHSSFWCPKQCGKRVVGLNVTELNPKDAQDGRRFICHNCETMFSVEELEEYGNNMARVYRQQEWNKKNHIPRMERIDRIKIIEVLRNG